MLRYILTFKKLKKNFSQIIIQVKTNKTEIGEFFVFQIQIESRQTTKMPPPPPAKKVKRQQQQTNDQEENIAFTSNGMSSIINTCCRFEGKKHIHTHAYTRTPKKIYYFFCV